MRLIVTLIDVYRWCIPIAVILSWFPVNGTSAGRVAARRTEPVLAPIRRVLPPMGGSDLSPMVLLIALQLLKGFFRVSPLPQSAGCDVLVVGDHVDAADVTALLLEGIGCAVGTAHEGDAVLVEAGDQSREAPTPCGRSPR